jgi:fatty acid desaturase
MSNALLRYFAWNMNYHAEHHLAPAIPFHRLAQAHVMLGPLLRTVASGYAAVQRQIWAAYPKPSRPRARRPA